MTFTIAVAGKGGVGKSTFAALAIRHLHEKSGAVILAVDADPNSNLGEKLGIVPERTIGDIREELMTLGEEPPEGMAKQEFLDYQVKLAVKEGDGVDLITMGRQEGPGCYCYVNNVLRQIIDSVAGRYEYVVIDNEAGMEHLSRRTTRSSNVLFVLCDSSRSSLEAAKRIAALATGMNLSIGKRVLVTNKIEMDTATTPMENVTEFERIHSVRRSASIQTTMKASDSLVGIAASDPAFVDISRIVDLECR